MSDQEFVDQVAEAITKALRQVSDVAPEDYLKLVEFLTAPD